MAKTGNAHLKNHDSTGEIHVDWNISDTCEHPRRVDRPELIQAKALDHPRAEPARSQRVDRKVTQDRPHAPRKNDPYSDSDTALYNAFDLEAQGPASVRGFSGVPETLTLGSIPGPDGLTSLTLDSLPDLQSHGGQSTPQFPKEGESVGGFRIILELGRGAFARVYLAEEISLGSRLVAIKVSKAEGNEPQILARLQHTHIVPVHSVHTDLPSGYRVLCMPYFGGANLAEVLESAGTLSNPVASRTGQSLIQALDRVSRQPVKLSNSDTNQDAGSRAGERNPVSLRFDRGTQRSYLKSHFCFHLGKTSALHIHSIIDCLFGGRPRGIPEDVTIPGDPACSRIRDAESEWPSRRFLQGASGVQAAVWIVARLAEGLDHAHARGLLHRDIKPSNILIAADGTPMLLDFNLSVDQAPANPETDFNRAMIGGTLPYMSPEHLDALNPQGTTDPAEVDGRSDIYALGLVFFEMIAGRHPFPDPPKNISLLETIHFMIEVRDQVPSLRAARPNIPWSLEALAAKCLDPNPDRRYAHAEDLAEDLRRFLDNRPMKHCPDPSPRERLGKWARRHPAISSSTSVGLLSLAMLMILGTSVNVLYNRIQDVAARLRLQVFRQGFADSQFWLNTQSDRIEHLKKGLLQSEQTLSDIGLAEPKWGFGTGWIWRLPPEEREQVCEQAVELCLLDARAGVKVAEMLGNESDRWRALERAVRLIDRAQRLTPRPTATLFAERANFQAALGHAELAESDRRKAAGLPLSSSYDYLLLGVSVLANGKYVEAEVPLKEAIKRDVTSFWAWFSLGHCHFQQGRFSDAVADFTACVVRGPKFAWAHFNLGLALAKSGRLLDARMAYDRSIDLDPNFPEALINRGLVELELNQLDKARDDLERGIAAGRDDPGVLAAFGETLARLGRHDEADRFFARTLVKTPNNPNIYVARGMTGLRADPRGARDDFTKALELDPNHATAHYGLARGLRAENPPEALHHLDEALASNPDLYDAIQLRALIRARLADSATTDDVDRLLEKPTPHRLYNASCALAIYSEKSKDTRWIRRSLDLLTRAVRMGFPIKEVAADSDLNILRQLPEFQRLIGAK